MTQTDLVHRSRRWFTVSRRLRSRYPLCCNPYDRHLETELVTSVHHVRPLATHPALAFDESNLVTLCRECHDYVEMLNGRGVDTVEHVLTRFQQFWSAMDKGEAAVPRCQRLPGGLVFCQRMCRNRQTRCGSCTDL